MRISEGDTPFRLPGSDSPLKKSTSVTAVIHGSQAKPTNVYYVDSLQRFRRDYASVDKQQRELKRQKHQENMSKRRNNVIQRDLSLKKLDDENYQRMQQRQTHSLYLHKVGSKMTIHSPGIPIDPLNLRYQNSEKGKLLEQADTEKHINTLVRAHKLQTCGTSGYNIINGQRNLTVEQMVPGDNYGVFQNKLNGYYQKFRIKPTNN